MFVSAQATTSSKVSLPFTIDPVTGGFTAGQTVTATVSGLILSFPFQVELLDEKDALPLFSTLIQLNPTSDGVEPFSFVVPTALR